MVRFKKRYFVVQFDYEKDISEPSHNKQNFKPRALHNLKPLHIHDEDLVLAIKDIVEKIHGDFGRAAITPGLRAIYSNPETHLALIQCRHGPHLLVGSSLSFLTNVNKEKIVPRLIYTGATIRNCFKRMEIHQKRQLEAAFLELKDISKEEKEELEQRIMSIRKMNN